MNKLKVLDLFSGIGGFSLGLERTGGFETVAFCEIEPYPKKVLRKHWPHVPIYDDVKQLTAERLGADRISVEVICGGFPCQDLSVAGKQAGIEGERSGLWSEFARLIGEIRPKYAIVENVSALLSGGRGRWFGRVLGDLAEVGYDAEWHCIPASAVGAAHRRDRIWVVAYSNNEGSQGGIFRAQSADQATQLAPGCGTSIPNSESQGLARSKPTEYSCTNGCATEYGRVLGRFYNGIGNSHQWSVEPDVGRVANGISSYVDRLKCLGNSVVPQIPELIGRSILEAEKQNER